MKSKLVFFIYLFIQMIHSQEIKLADQNNNLLINHKLIISQESMVLERLTDSTAKIKLNSKLFDFSKPIDFKPLGFISNKLIVKNDTLLTFLAGNLQLDEVLISNVKKKEVDFQNFKKKENRLSWILQNQHNVTGSLAPNYEYITLIDQFDFKVDKTNFKEILFETFNKLPHLDIPITYRLNIYNKDKELIYSQDKKIQSSEINNRLTFNISQYLSLPSNLFYVGLSIPREKPLNDYYEEYPDYFILFEHRRFKKAKSYKKYLFDSDKPEWQLISEDNNNLDEITKQLFLSNPENPLKNYNLKITITTEQLKK